jgi:hypothetical protein
LRIEAVNPFVTDHLAFRERAPTTQALAKALSRYYWPNEMRGQHCQVEHYTRPGGNEYFFAYLDNWPDIDRWSKQSCGLPV